MELILLAVWMPGILYGLSRAAVAVDKLRHFSEVTHKINLKD